MKELVDSVWQMPAEGLVSGVQEMVFSLAIGTALALSIFVVAALALRTHRSGGRP